MTNLELQQLSVEEQSFIKEHHLEHETLDTIHWLESNYDYAVYKGYL